MIAKRHIKVQVDNLITDAERIEEELNRAGLKPVTRPSYYQKVEMPDDVTRLGNAELGKLHARFVAMFCYANSMLAKSSVRLSARRTQLRQLETQLSLLHGDGAEKWRTQNAVQNSPMWKKINRKVFRMETNFTLLESVVMNFDRCAQALSREMSRRHSEMQNAV